MKMSNLLCLSLLVVCSAVFAEEQAEESNKSVVTIKSTFVVDSNDLEGFLDEAAQDCKAITRKYAEQDGVRSVESTVENEDANKCNCGKPRPRDGSINQDEQDVKSCSSCCKPKPSCSSCCKTEEVRCDECDGSGDYDSEEQDVKSCSSCCKPKPSCSSCCK